MLCLSAWCCLWVITIKGLGFEEIRRFGFIVGFDGVGCWFNEEWRVNVVYDAPCSCVDVSLGYG